MLPHLVLPLVAAFSLNIKQCSLVQLRAACSFPVTNGTATWGWLTACVAQLQQTAEVRRLCVVKLLCHVQQQQKFSHRQYCTKWWL